VFWFVIPCSLLGHNPEHYMDLHHRESLSEENESSPPAAGITV
jgi:hypothetical protein